MPERDSEQTQQMSILYGKLISTGYKLLDTAHKLQNPESLPVLPTEQSSVETARKTLRFLRNLQHTEQDAENWLNTGSLDEQQVKTQHLESLINVYAGQVKIAYLSNPELLNHFTIEHANDAVGSLALSISLHVMEILPEENDEIAALDERLSDDIPPQWDDRQGQSVERLIDAIESALSHLTNKPISDRSPVDRLIEASNNIQNAVRRLYSLDTLEDPAREESIELAREILRRLKNMSFSDKNISDAIDTGRPDEKLAFAKRIEEMVDSYKNILSEAMRSNPDIIKDPRVKNANDAAGDCANGIKLMAAKEIPTDSLEFQQISAETADDIENDKRRAETSINRTMNKMEGGLEHAAEEVAQGRDKKLHQLEKEERIQSEKRRKRRHKQHLIMIKHLTHKTHQAKLHEKLLNNMQGKLNSVGNLNQIDIEAIRNAGTSLRKNHKQANDILALNQKIEKENKAKNNNAAGTSLTIQNVSMDSILSPDDRSFVERERDPMRNPNHPRNKPRIV